jgi:penicillin-insensitive murein endopeptidase
VYRTGVITVRRQLRDNTAIGPVLLGGLTVALLSLMPGWDGGAAQAAPRRAVAMADAVTEGDAHDLLTPPDVSLSLGKTSAGRLLRARSIPLMGEHYAFFPHIETRRTHYGTEEMHELVQRISAAVAERYPASIMALGNVSLEHGGHSQWHASHQSGRDVDIAFYLVDEQGRPQRPDNFVAIGRDGRSRDGGLVFDTPRNLALITSLLADQQAPVQWIFVARWLKEMLIEEAEREALPDQMIARMQDVLLQPGDSSPHHDHLHVRIYCSLRGRMYGCLDRAPLRPWVDRDDEAWSIHVRQVVDVLRMSSPDLKIRALDLLARMRVARAVSPVLRTLNEPRQDVRDAGLRALAVIGSPAAGPGLLANMRKSQDANWARRVFEVYRRLDVNGVADVARRLVLRPRSYVHRKVARGAMAPLYIAASEVLLERGGRSAVRPLLKLVSSRDRKVRVIAHRALIHVTNQRVTGSIGSSNPKRWRRVANKWKRFWRKNSRRSWLHWMRRGFRGHGVRMRGRHFTRRDLPRLIGAIGHRNKAVSRNALRVLTELTRHKSPVYRGTRKREVRRLKKHWRWWYKRHRRRLRFRRG